MTTGTDRYQDRWKCFLPASRSSLNPPEPREKAKNLSFRTRTFIYKLDKNLRTFTEHEEEAKKFGGHLASITSEGEHNFLVELCKDFVDDGHYMGPFIGGQRLQAGTGKGDDTWKWTDGTPWGGYENWATGEPDDSANREDVLHLSDKERGFKWNDIPTDRRMSGIYKRRKLDSSDVLSSVNYIILKNLLIKT